MNPYDHFWQHRCQRFVSPLRDKFNDADLTLSLTKRFGNLWEHRPIAEHFLTLKDDSERFDAPNFVHPKLQSLFRQA